MSTLHLDAEALYADLVRGVRGLLGTNTVLVGVWSGGAWLAERLQRDLQLAGEPGVISSSLHRDDFGSKGMSASADHTRLPFSVDDADILLIDDVLYTGRTTRAVINELFDFGRPASVRLAVLVDRGGRQLPIEPVFSAARVTLAPAQALRLARDPDGRFTFDLKKGEA
ncbi:MAG: bifunctional pyr operon transcriptional regulator/uracil phosphoribosyltransferase PyrR [Paucibacter sp.]|nr:bifunctional pyr operon transcriptional regulator/uracil phosphoribosyltransferase PyrR [Roseateles sp.]